MDEYLNTFREMISLRSPTDHTLIGNCTYIRAYLDYLSNILHKLPEVVFWNEMRVYIRWIQKSRGLSDRTINCVISQLWFLPFMFFIDHGITYNFQCASLTNIFPTSHPNRTSNVDLLTIKALIGHTSLNSTTIYYDKQGIMERKLVATLEFPGIVPVKLYIIKVLSILVNS